MTQINGTKKFDYCQYLEDYYFQLLADQIAGLPAHPSEEELETFFDTLLGKNAQQTSNSKDELPWAA